MWFEKLTGFSEQNPQQVRENIAIAENKLISKVTGNEFTFGKLELLSLEDLRNRTKAYKGEYKSRIQISEAVGDVQSFHNNILNKGAFFQVASQFNLLEMVHPGVTPEHGVGIYENDRTQGPACSIACGAATIYRNYFVNINNQTGQSNNNQIDCLEDIGLELNNDGDRLWKMSNGYALVNDEESLSDITKQIESKSKEEYEHLKSKLKIGIQWDTEVTISESKHLVSQAFCSALPIAYHTHLPRIIDNWTEFACLVLEASYEATFHSALINYENTGNNKVFLTLLGGGVFGNKHEWIFDAIRKSIQLFSNTPLDIRIVSYGNSNPHLVAFIESTKN
jgi:hypothetical protein